MPYIIRGNNRTTTPQDKYDYDYPFGMDLRPGSELHERIVTEVMERAERSNSFMSRRYSTFREIDATMTAYIPVDDDEEDITDIDSRKPVSIVFPSSYAVMETILTYMMTAFFRNPIFKYKGTHPSSILAAKMLETVVQRHCVRNKVHLALHTMFRDSLCYGFGTAVPTWESRYGMRRKRASGALARGIQKFTGDKEYGIVFEGNALRNIDPYLCLPDPVPGIQNVQDGEYFGWIERQHINTLLADENTNADVFNALYLKDTDGKSALNTDENDRQIRFSGGMAESKTYNENSVDRIGMYINLIPEDWGLGSSQYPTKWFFEVCGDSIITQAFPLELSHGMFPSVTVAPDFDGYSSTPMSRMEVLYGMQKVLNFMFNSHVANVRKSLNDMFVVDPYLINIDDLTQPGPGKLVRMRRHAWGRGVQDAIMQLGVQDITRQNIGDSSFIMSWMSHIAGADESMMGSLRQGGPERLTGAEFQGTRSSAMSRLQRMAMIMSYQGLQDIAYFFGIHTQDFMENEDYVEIVGELPELYYRDYTPGELVKVSPDDLNIDFEVDMSDGSIPDASNASMWLKVLEIVGGNEVLASRFNVENIFSRMAREMGVQEIDKFKRPVNATLMNDEQAVREVEKGNLKPAPRGA